MAVFISTASEPMFHRQAASDAVPTPASTISGTSVISSRRMRKVRRVLQAQAAADGRAQRHHRRRARIDQPLRKHNVVGGVGQNGETFLHQDPRRFERRLHIRIERRLVADDLDLHPVREAHLAAQPRGANRLVGGVAAGRIGQQEVALRIDEVEQRLARSGPGSRAAPRR